MEVSRPMESTSTSSAPQILNTADIMALIPHRPPFLLIDKAVILEPQKKIIAYKGVTMNEPFFAGHFPGQPIMPGVLMVEAMAQAACVVLLSRPDLKNRIAFFMAIDGVKFRRPVVPGDLLELRVEILRAGGRVGKARGETYVGAELVTEAEFTFVIADKP
jgi:beta-hydroxyacyl-ACP dehydratase FabZ